MFIRTVLVDGSAPARQRPHETDLLLLCLLTAVVAAVLAAGPASSPRLATAWWLACALLLASSDALTHRIPLGPVALMSAGTLLLLAGTGDGAALARSFLTGTGLALAVLLLCLPRNGLGLGDAAIAFPIGLALGWTGWPAVGLWLLTASLLLSVTATTMLALGRVSRRSRLPLGPFLLLAVVPAVLI